MPIIFNKQPGEEGYAKPDSRAALAREKRLTANSKRILRRQRINAAKEGIVIPYEPRSKPVDPDAPKLSNHAKRMARKRKKFAAELAAVGLTVEEGGPTYLKKKKNKKNKTDVSDEKPSTSENPGTDQPEVTTDEPEKKKRRKKLKNTKKMENNSSEEKYDGELVPKKEIDIKIEDEKMEKPVKKQRFILFVGNLSYEATEEEIRSHFQKVGTILSIRISKHVDKAMEGKSKGFAHLEVADETSYLKALSMHHSKMNGRRINVEYSSGQTKEIRIVQKAKTRAIKEALASGNTLDLANPSNSKIKNKKKGKKRVKKEAANTVWV